MSRCNGVVFSGYNDATSVNAFYFAGYSRPSSWCFLLEADVYIAVIVLTDVKPYKYKIYAAVPVTATFRHCCEQIASFSNTGSSKYRSCVNKANHAMQK
jgi:hypothetical protein